MRQRTPVAVCGRGSRVSESATVSCAATFPRPRPVPTNGRHRRDSETQDARGCCARGLGRASAETAGCGLRDAVETGSDRRRDALLGATRPSRHRGGSAATAGCEETDRRGRAGKPDVEPPRPGDSADDDERPLITLRYQRLGENHCNSWWPRRRDSAANETRAAEREPDDNQREPPHRNLFRQARRPLPRGDPPPTPAQCQPRSTA